MSGVLAAAFEAPEGWIKKIERRREGKVWVGFFHLWTTDADGGRVRQKKEKTLRPASMPKHEAQQKLAEGTPGSSLCCSRVWAEKARRQDGRPAASQQLRLWHRNAERPELPSAAELRELVVYVEMISHGAGDVVKAGLQQDGVVERTLDQNHLRTLPDLLPRVQATLGARQETVRWRCGRQAAAIEIAFQRKHDAMRVGVVARGGYQTGLTQ
jgi:hypothetical protein